MDYIKKCVLLMNLHFDISIRVCFGRSTHDPPLWLSLPPPIKVAGEKFRVKKRYKKNRYYNWILFQVYKRNVESIWQEPWNERFLLCNG